MQNNSRTNPTYQAIISTFFTRDVVQKDCNQATEQFDQYDNSYKIDSNFEYRHTREINLDYFSTRVIRNCMRMQKLDRSYLDKERMKVSDKITKSQNKIEEFNKLLSQLINTLSKEMEYLIGGKISIEIEDANITIKCQNENNEAFIKYIKQFIEDNNIIGCKISNHVVSFVIKEQYKQMEINDNDKHKSVCRY